MTAVLGATMAVGVAAAGAGWFIWQTGRSRLSAASLLLAGALLLLGVAAVLLDLEGGVPVLFRLAGCLFLPVAFLTYPRHDWRDPFSGVLAAVVVTAGLSGAVWETAFAVAGYVVVGALLLHVWWAFERGEVEERRALTWSALAWSGAALFAAFLAFWGESLERGTATGLSAVCLACFVAGPVAMVVGAVRPDVVDVRGLVTRAVVTATVFTTLVAVAAAVSSAIGELSGKPLAATPAIVLCALLAFGVRPLQVLLRGVVDQLLFGDRPDPLAAATSLVDRIGDDPTLALDALREALVLPFASLRAGGAVLASSGSEVTHTRVLPLRLGDDEVGEVVVGLRAGDLRLSSADEHVLRIVAPLLAQTLRARALSRELQQSREAVVAAVEEERLRLRRDLHDGLGPTLSGVAFATDAARNQLRGNPDLAEELLVRLRADTAGAIAEIRRLVEGLRPPALDELGLLGAIQQHAVTLHSASGTPLTVTMAVPPALPTLSAATEVATYRIVVEALTNVAKHAGATRASVSLDTRDGVLVVAVRDDGTSSESWSPGVGITSMRVRSDQVGGTLRADAGPAGGLVEATIPLPAG
ncbi:hypothetical protein ASE01_20655 [Nocardioides sp. Root190]|uniref:sensor histidine kinase n=1 Tax=Nocardioides sp. Root190 TaxID=1736488 RepID=UPI0006F2AB35|nr:sensor histidine kinase [Nocardioides sp. Root190]KRB73174.1 hypothetical protein ASE01_20655 [Nocardioides sp. Root190]